MSDFLIKTGTIDGLAFVFPHCWFLLHVSRSYTNFRFSILQFYRYWWMGNLCIWQL